jgi:anti-anti-sigma regulatory factor
MPIQQWSEEILLVTLPAGQNMREDILALQRNLEENENQNVVLDFSNVDFIIEGNLLQLLGINRSQERRKRKLILCSVAPAIKGVFLVLGLDGIFEIANDRFVALRGFNRTLTARLSKIEISARAFFIVQD